MQDVTSTRHGTLVNFCICIHVAVASFALLAQSAVALGANTTIYPEIAATPASLRHSESE